MRNKLVASFSSLKHTSLFLIVCINLSTSPLARSSLPGASIISKIFLLQKVLTRCLTNHFARSKSMERGISLFSTYKFKNFSTLGPFALSNIHAGKIWKKQIFAARKYISCLFNRKLVS